MNPSPKLFKLPVVNPVPNMMTVQKTYQFDPEKDLIGKGGFGSVYKAKDLSLDIWVAIKKYSGQLPAKYSLFEEIKRAIQLNHPNLIRYYDAFELKDNTAFGDKIQVGVLEYANGGDLYQLFKGKSDFDTLSKIFQGIMLGLQYLHERGIIHRDLKPENILLHREESLLTPKIADFGISKVLDDKESGSSLVIGTISYMAPEQFNLKKYGKNKELHTNLDLWSLGTIIYEAFTGDAPFGKTEAGMSRSEVMRNILDKEVSELDKIPEPFQEIVRRCLVKDASQRVQKVDELLWVLYDHYDTKSQPKDALTAYKSVSKEQVFNTTVLEPALSGLRKEKKPVNTPPTVSDYQEPALVEPLGSDVYDTEDMERPVTNQQSTTSVEEGTGFKAAMLIPVITGLLGYASYQLKGDLFAGAGSSISSYILYPAIICGVMMLINLISIFVRKEKQAFEWITYMSSFLLLGFIAIKSYLIFQYADLNLQGFIWKFDNHSFAKLFPFVAGLLLVFSFIMAYVNRKR